MGEATYSADYWYRASDDPDRSVRTVPQMTAPVRDERHAATIRAELLAQGYEVQRVTLQVICPTCDGEGRIGRKPKGRRRACPPWMLTYTDCATCDRQGYVSRHDMPFD